jgi:hypothetical protein
MTNPGPSHLFISCAAEDFPLAQWLAGKLTARGHAVWFDKMKSLAGEPWPHAINEIIKERTFRVLALISQDSLRKKKPTAERTLAQRIGRQQKIADFLIPLITDKSESHGVADAAFQISFANGWANGWKALVRKLDSIKAPCPLRNGAALAASSFPRGDDLVSDVAEPVHANIIRVKSFPAALRVFQAADSMGTREREALERAWTFYEISRDAIVALIPPPPEFSDAIRPTHEQLLWAEPGTFHNVHVRDIAGRLILKALSRRLLHAGCLKHPHPRFRETYYLPENFAVDGQLAFTGFDGKKNHLPIRSKITFRRSSGVAEVNFHHFAVRLQLARGLDKDFHVQLTPTLVFFDENGQPIPDDKSLLARLRRVTKTWDNEQWLNRLVAAAQILNSAPPAGVNDPLLEPGLLALSSPRRLDEAILDGTREQKEPPEELVLDEPETEDGNE